MKNCIRLSIVTVAVGLFLLPTCSFAEDQVSGSVAVGGGTYLNGRRDSSKFEEYREVPDGAFGGAEIKYQSDLGYHADIRGEGLNQDDQELSLSSGVYGCWNLDLDYNKIPHRYAYGATSLFSGIGSDDLRLSDALQATEQNSTSSAQLASTLNAEIPSATLTDIGIERKRGRATFDLMKFDPFNLQLEVKRDERTGTKPLGVGFGFSNAIEVIEPRDYKTTEFKVQGEYATKEVYASITYYASVFENNIDTLSWDNPFRKTDGTSPTAYTNPGGGTTNPATGVFTPFTTVGPSRGLEDLAPDNFFNNVSLTGVLRELPLNSQLSAAASWGWMRQDDDLVPYTTNTAITPASGFGIPFDATDLANLPASSADRSVNTSLYNIALTSRPLSFMDAKAHYRYYERDDTSSTIDFPGYVRFDAVWEEVPEETTPIGYYKHNAGLDLGFDVYDQTKLGLGYVFDQTNRDNREVSKTNDNTFEVSLDNASIDWLNVKASYHHAVRELSGNYDPAAPFPGEEVIPQLPFLRKYDEADRKKDDVMLLASVSPTESLGFTGAFTFGKSDYNDSSFGLLDDQFFVYSVDADYAFNDRTKAYLFYSFETHESNQDARQWTPGGVGDPFTRDLGLASNSNWSAKATDDINTVGVGCDVAIIPDTLIFKATYTLSDANGEIKHASPLGTALVDDANAFVPANYDDVGDTVIHTLNPTFIMPLSKNLKFTVGYLWEKYDVNDYQKDGFSNVVTNPAGNYNAGLLMGTLPFQNYEVNFGYMKFDYLF